MAQTTAEAEPTSIEQSSGAQTLPEMVRRSAIRHESAALRCARADRLTEVSYAELVRIVRKIAQQAGSWR